MSDLFVHFKFLIIAYFIHNSYVKELLERGADIEVNFEEDCPLLLKGIFQNYLRNLK